MSVVPFFFCCGNSPSDNAFRVNLYLSNVIIHVMSKKWNIVDLTRLRVNKSCTLRFFYVEKKTSTTLILRKKLWQKTSYWNQCTHSPIRSPFQQCLSGYSSQIASANVPQKIRDLRTLARKLTSCLCNLFSTLSCA